MGRLSGLLGCPECRGERGGCVDADTLACSSCGAHFPRLGRIPILVPDARGLLERWRRGLSSFVSETEGAQRHLLAELLDPHLAPSTRRRLGCVASAMPEHRRAILQLFEEADLEPASPTPQAAGQTEPTQLLDYVTLIHRDFGWSPEVDEITPAFDRLLDVLPSDFRLGKALVLGAGTGRLAWDLAVRFPDAHQVLALDLNPLPLLVTQRLLAGQEVTLFELPGHPRRADLAAVPRTLRAPSPAPPHLQLLIADGLRPPFAPGSFDTVVTPWFLDQVPSDLAAFLPEIHRLLAPGGSWLHTGPFVYAPAHTKPAHRYGQDEFLELAQRTGFAITTSSYEPEPYLCSPASTQGRREWVLCLHAIRQDAPASAQEPAWLEPTYTSAVPPQARPEGAVLPLPIVAKVAALIDGRRTVLDIARELVLAGELADDGNAEAATVGCLRVLWQAAR